MRDLTTTEAGKLLGISPQTVRRCVARGLLKGYRIPGDGKRHCRIPRADLEAFAAEHGIEVSRPFGEG